MAGVTSRSRAPALIMGAPWPPAVNLAARVAAQAAGGRLLAMAAVADAARAWGIDVVRLGERRFRNIAEPVSIFELCLEPGDGWETIDPVCRMRVAPDHAVGSLVYDGRRFGFCSLACAGVFVADPARHQADVQRATES